MLSILLLGLLLGLIITYAFQEIKILLRILKQHTLIISGYHIHHSVLGVILILIALIFIRPFLIGLGLGIIIAHTISNKEFLLIEKMKKHRKSEK